jgi:hypothetical protein
MRAEEINLNEIQNLNQFYEVLDTSALHLIKNHDLIDL